MFRLQRVPFFFFLRRRNKQVPILHGRDTVTGEIRQCWANKLCQRHSKRTLTSVKEVRYQKSLVE